jgi:GT2 family glycosyltransferase
MTDAASQTASGRILPIPGSWSGGPCWLLLTGRVPARSTDITLEARPSGRSWDDPACLRMPLAASHKGMVIEVLRLPLASGEVRLTYHMAQGPAGTAELTVRRLTGIGRLLRQWNRSIQQKLRFPGPSRRLGLTWARIILEPSQAYALATTRRGLDAPLTYPEWLEDCDAMPRRPGWPARLSRGLRSIPAITVLIDGRDHPSEAIGITVASLAQSCTRPARIARLGTGAGGSTLTAVAAEPAELATWLRSGAGTASSRTLIVPAGTVFMRYGLWWWSWWTAANRDAPAVSCDYDQLDEHGRRGSPSFLPQWNLTELRTVAVRPLVMFKTCELLAVLDGMAASARGGIATPELLLRLSERHGLRTFVHCPAVTASLPGPAPAALSPRMVAEHLRRMGVAADVARREDGSVWVGYVLPATPPRVTLIVPTRDRLAVLRPCLESLLTMTDYPDWNVLVVDNGSIEPQTIAYLDTLTAAGRIRVLRDEGPFNFSRLNNRAVEVADGDAVLLLNNDTEIIEGGWLRALVAHLVQPGTGVVGAKLLYPDGTVQHGGVVVGPGGCADHLHVSIPGDAPGYMGRALQPQEVSAVTGACLLTWRRLYRTLGGLDEQHLAVAFNDVDYCLRVRAHGKRIVWTPEARLIHHESISRGRDDTLPEQRRAHAEIACMRARWPAEMTGDPFYNPNFSCHRVDWQLSEDRFEPSPRQPTHLHGQDHS